MNPRSARHSDSPAAAVRRIAVRVSRLCALLYVGLCLMLYLAQDSLLYHPVPSSRTRAGSTQELRVDGAELQLSVRPRPGRDALIYFGGNAEDVSLSLPAFVEALPGHALFLMHYRGYVGSTGSPSEEALHRDALALFDRVHAEHEQVVLIGRSLGSGIALRLASQRPAHRLILVTPYDSLLSIAARQYPLFPIRWLMRDTYDAGKHAPEISIPTLIVAAEHDRVIPRENTDRLRARFAPGIVSFVVLPGTRHNTISHSPAYVETLRAGL